MFADLEIFQMSAKMANHAGRRQALTAQNMANADTPGYRAKRLASFADSVELNTPRTAMIATRPDHMHESLPNTLNDETMLVRGEAAPDGNSVSIEREMLESVNAKREHERAIAIYRSALNILHMSVARR